MCKPLRELPFVKIKVTIVPYEVITNQKFKLYFRTFKNKEECVEDNHYSSTYLGHEDDNEMAEHYGCRKSAMDMIYREIRNKKCSSAYLVYDKKFVPCGLSYHTDGEFAFVKNLIEEALQGTGLFMAFLVSHFNQLSGKNLTEKPEHYHLLLRPLKQLSDNEYMTALKKFADNLSCDLIDVKFKTDK